MTARRYFAVIGDRAILIDGDGAEIASMDYSGRIRDYLKAINRTSQLANGGHITEEDKRKIDTAINMHAEMMFPSVKKRPRTNVPFSPFSPWARN